MNITSYDLLVERVTKLEAVMDGVNTWISSHSECVDHSDDEMKIKLFATNRGFIRGEFKDLYGEECSIQESSAADVDALWLGCNAGTHHPVEGGCAARMHLGVERARMIIKLLQHFVKTGGLRKV